MNSNLVKKIEESLGSATICLRDAKKATNMADRVSALDSMEHDLQFIALQLEKLLEECYEDNGDLKGVTT